MISVKMEMEMVISGIGTVMMNGGESRSSQFLLRELGLFKLELFLGRLRSTMVTEENTHSNPVVVAHQKPCGRKTIYTWL